MLKGKFYASSGVFLRQCSSTLNTYVIEVDEERTQAELARPELRGRLVEEGQEGYRIEFIGKGGEILRTVHGLQASVSLDQFRSPYIRARVILTRKRSTIGYEEFYAWGAAYFCTHQR